MSGPELFVTTEFDCTFLSWIVSWVIVRLLGENKLYFSIHVRLWQGCNLLAFLKSFSRKKMNWAFGYFLAFWNYICPTLAFLFLGLGNPVVWLSNSLEWSFILNSWLFCWTVFAAQWWKYILSAIKLADFFALTLLR